MVSDAALVWLGVFFIMVSLRLECLKLAYSLMPDRTYSEVMEFDKIYAWVRVDGLSDCKLEKEMD